jgi:hypothetical protein
MKNEFKVVGHHLATDYSSVHEKSLDLLNHSTLDKDPVYSTLKTDLAHYYSESTKHKEKPPGNSELKGALYSNLHSLLSEVTYTKDQRMQKQMLASIHNWYLKKKPTKDKLPSIQYHHHPSKPHIIEPAKTPVPRPAETSASETDYSAVHRSPSPYLPRRYQSTDLSDQPAVSVSMEARYLEMRKKDFENKKEAENRQKIIAKWGLEKSRATADHAHRVEQTRISAYKRPASPDVVKLKHVNYSTFPVQNGKVYDFKNENNSNVVESENIRMTPDIHKINKLRKLHASLLDVEAEFQTPKKRKNESSMSVYRQHQESFDSSLQGRAKSSGKVNDQYEEVLLAKSRLASMNVPCPVSYLINGLVLPDDKITAVTHDMLPKGGECLISNPFVKFGKKKKKGKKKGKKKKKA